MHRTATATQTPHRQYAAREPPQRPVSPAGPRRGPPPGRTCRRRVPPVSPAPQRVPSAPAPPARQALLAPARGRVAPADRTTLPAATEACDALVATRLFPVVAGAQSVAEKLGLQRAVRRRAQHPASLGLPAVDNVRCYVITDHPLLAADPATTS